MKTGSFVWEWRRGGEGGFLAQLPALERTLAGRPHSLARASPAVPNLPIINSILWSKPPAPLLQMLQSSYLRCFMFITALEVDRLYYVDTLHIPPSCCFQLQIPHDFVAPPPLLARLPAEKEFRPHFGWDKQPWMQGRLQSSLQEDRWKGP